MATGALPQETMVCIAGCGPAGAMLGLMLARTGVDVVVLEQYADFFRDFRGDTIHASTLQVLDELGLLGGFEQPTEGQILLDGVDVAQSPPHKRPVNTVFRSYALFPHLDVHKNVGYGLRWHRDLDKRTRDARVAQALELVQLSEYARRRPHQITRGARRNC